MKAVPSGRRLGRCWKSFVFCLLALSSSAMADGFSFGDLTLSSRVSVSNTGYWDARAGVYFSTTVQSPNFEPYKQYEIVYGEGPEGSPPTLTRRVTAFATGRREIYYIAFEGPLNAREAMPARGSPDTRDRCLKMASSLNGVVRSIQQIGYAGIVDDIVLDPNLPEEARSESLAAIDAWISQVARRQGPISAFDLAYTKDFKDLAYVLGPRFRGALITCYASDVGADLIWQTRFLDLSLAGTVFNLDPE